MSDHFDGTRFHNQRNRLKSGFNVIRWMLQREPGTWRRWTDAPPGPPPPKRVEGDRLRITFVNHTTILIQLAGLNILTDPVWSERVSPVGFAGPKRHRPPGIRFEDLPPIDLVLVSHNHYDHMDIPTLRRLHAAHHPEVITTLGNTRFLGMRGIDRSTDLDWWEKKDVEGGLEVICVPAEHFSGRGTGDRNMTLWGGFVLRHGDTTIYFAADTGDGPHFEQIRERLGPITLSLLPIGAYRPVWFMQPVHMGPDEAARAHATLESRLSMATHFGTFAMADDGEFEPVEDLLRGLEKEKIAPESFRALDHGESWEIDLRG